MNNSTGAESYIMYTSCEVIRMIKQEVQETFRTIRPSILYFGTPVVLLTTLSEDGSTNISPLSSAWALGNRIILGIGNGGKGLENLSRTGECVINLPDSSLWEQVEKLAPLTGKSPVPDNKRELYRFERDKFAAAGFTPLPSTCVKPQRIQECPLQIEAALVQVHPSEGFCIVETESRAVHAEERIVLGEHYVNPAAWNPLIYSFRHYFGLDAEKGKSFKSET